jgi:hypothetical protein
MQLGDLFRDLDDDTYASEVLAAYGNAPLMTRVHETAERFEESASEYVSGSVRRFAKLANDEDWLALMTKLEGAPDPSVACLVHMIGWSLKRDAAPAPEPHAGCSCGGGNCG